VRRIPLILLILITSVFTACSFLTDFVVVNESDNAIAVRYKVKNFPGPFAPPDTPATIAADQLDAHGGQHWKDLTSDQYQLVQENRTVLVRVAPHQALLIARLSNYGIHRGPEKEASFPIEEIIVAGADGEMILEGQQAIKNFSEVSSALYTLTYK
jgi:hypothetical protein